MIIPKEAEPYELPAIQKLLVQKGVYELDDKLTGMFVKDRIIPLEILTAKPAQMY